MGIVVVLISQCITRISANIPSFERSFISGYTFKVDKNAPRKNNERISKTIKTTPPKKNK